VAQAGVNYQGTVLRNAPTIYQAPVTVGSSGGSLTTASGVNATLAGPVTMGGANASYVMSNLGPADVGLKAWSFAVDAATGTASAVTVAGSVYLTTTHLTGGVTYGTIYLKFQANGGTASTGSNFAGLYNSAGYLVATSNDISLAMGTAAGSTGYITCPLATAYTPSGGGQYWVGAFFNASAAGSFPVLYARSGFVTVSTSAGNGVNGIAGPVQATPYPYAAVATSSATALPSSFTLGSAGTTGAYVYWAGLA
jgi:hypothetical protein